MEGVVALGSPIDESVHSLQVPNSLQCNSVHLRRHPSSPAPSFSRAFLHTMVLAHVYGAVQRFMSRGTAYELLTSAFYIARSVFGMRRGGAQRVQYSTGQPTQRQAQRRQSTAGASGEIPSITTAELAERIKRKAESPFVLLDVRGPAEV